MKINDLHPWNPSYQEAKQLQTQLASKISTENQVNKVRLIAGIDVSVISPDSGRAGLVILSYPELELIEVVQFEGALNFPYIPGLLSFRELPLALAAFKKLSSRPDIVLVDGQGLAHPRGLGLASHLGLIIETPTIGCAKSLLCGKHGPVGIVPGCSKHIEYNGSIVGTALRTKLNVKPVFISIGHMIDLQSSVDWTLKCCRGYRLPEPSRLAHQASKGNLAPLGL
jgi:deoxyribonuclease V